jgi:hypothetical protein
LGFLLDPTQCRYDPTKDAAALCSGVSGNGGVVGTNANAANCVNLAEARAIDKMWYGQTADGTYVDPALDNAGSPTLANSNHLWWGQMRGAGLLINAGAAPFSVATDMVALGLQDPTYATPTFTNPTGNGADKWKTLDYAGLANSYYRQVALQPFFANINTDNPDLSGARDAGAKILTYHGLADQFIMSMGSINYFTRVADTMGGVVEAQKFDRLFLIPGLAHDGSFSSSGSLDPNTGATTSVNKVPLPQAVTGRDELFTALRNWVESGVAPTRIDVSSADSSVTMPLCLYPKKATYSGTGSDKLAANYSCQ